ncbi:hypothetical protein SAMN05216511_7210 [Streptomyces sp. KS_16]|uniref:hypothetical protein n=1 Tax=unclassified Streptomyces TaxID=2593676 RepID=UPI00088ECCB3|nr:MULTISPECIES: hypothetical protein [unclassified Streptomyces]PBC72275.1 hypothetical protein BX261_7359 [Streptomyces sp. 2321.6]SDR61879.1 hypothetical protein SAMN05216511_7210 [Streptomyces sp. KS_16]SNC77780.1 hypothetical protein SAMN06272741_7196 [Streptomyces sp. 2114.4]
MAEIYNQLGDAATITLVGLALILRDDFRLPAWIVAIPGSLYTLRWIALDDTGNAISGALFTAIAVALLTWISHGPKTEGAA